MQRLEVSGAVRPMYGSLGVKRLKKETCLLPVGYRTVVARYRTPYRNPYTD